MDEWKPRYLKGDGSHRLDKKRVAEDSLIIKKLGASAISFAPGISIRTPGGGLVSCDEAGCNWLMRILVSIDNQDQVATLSNPMPNVGR